jgi:RND family efflux transporter MFP subunit
MSRITGSRIKRLGLVLALACTTISCGGGDGAEKSAEENGRIVAVTLTQARKENVSVEIYSVGRLVSRNAPVLAAEINARITRVMVDEGEPVERGQVLIQLDTTTSELSRREAQAEIQRLEASIDNEQRRVTRYRELKAKDMMPQERLDDAEAKLAVDRATLAAAGARLAIAEDALAKAELVSPVSGVVEKRHVFVGDYVKTGGALVTITDTRNLRAELPFPETVGHRLEVGQAITLESPIAPGLVLQATVDQIRPQVGSLSRSLVVIADVENPGNWRPEATLEATLTVENRPDSIVVPILSLVKRPAGDVVYRLANPQSQRVEQVLVEPGVRLNGRIEIIRGLAAGDLIVEEGAYYLSDGARIDAQESPQ